MDATTQYASDVLDGTILAGPYVRQACQRHMDDLENGAERGLHFDIEAAQRGFEFFEFLVLPSEDGGLKRFILEPSQQFIVGSLLGWYGVDGFRRFHYAYIEEGKGAGKTPMAAGLCDYGLMADDEQDAQVFSTAVSRDQAGIAFQDGKSMISRSPELRKHVKIHEHSITYLPSRSTFKPLSSEGSTMEGFRPHFVSIDELHRHKSPVVVERMHSGTKGRRQPLIVEITNAGSDRQSICFKHHNYGLQILEKSISNDRWFFYICALDKDDDWTDPDVWIKTNPLIGVTVTHEYLAERVKMANDIPSEANNVKRLNFCMWTQTDEKWLDSEKWASLYVEREEGDLGPAVCFGLDQAEKVDFTAQVFYFPSDPEGGRDKPYITSYFWLPKGSIDRRQDPAIRDQLRAWADQDWLTLTAGSVIDFEQVDQELIANAQYFGTGLMAYDPYRATRTALKLQEAGIEPKEFRQGVQSMSEPSMELERLILSGEIEHDGNPVLTWMIGNAVKVQDTNGNIKPDRSRSADKIDGVISLVMAIGMATLRGYGPSVYENRGVVFLDN